MKKLDSYDENQNIFMQNKDYSLLIFLTGIVAFTIGLAAEFTGFDCRAAMFAQEMFRNGPTFFPTTYGQPYPDYTAASTFMIYLVSLIFGKVTPLTATLPTAIVSSLVLVITYRIGAIRSKKWGLFAVLLLLFTKGFFSLSRRISQDQYTTLVTALSFYLIYSSTVYHKQKRLWFIPLLFVVGFIFRGPIGLVIPTAVVCIYYLFNRDFKLFALMASAASILLIICFKGLLVAAAYQGQETFAHDVWVWQVSSRMGQITHWVGYYFSESFTKYAIVYPFAVIVIIARFKEIFKCKNSDYRLIAYLVLWMLVVVLGMSVPGCKKIRYILPIIPAAALVASYMFVEPFRDDIVFGTKKWFLVFCSWFPLGTTIAILVTWVMNKQGFIHFEVNYLAVAVCSALLTISVYIVRRKYKEGFPCEFAFVAIAAVMFIVIKIGITDVRNFNRNRTRPFVQKVISLQKQQPGEIAFYKIGSDSDAIKFMANLDKPILPKFANSPETILSYNEPVYFISTNKDFIDLPEYVAHHVRELDHGKIDNTECVIFKIEESFQ